KAKELRMHVEPLITLAKRGDLHARRQVAAQVYTKENVQKLFDDLAVRFKDRKGGYTRIFKANQRLGDGAPMAMIEFLDRKASGSEGKKAPAKKTAAKKATAKKEAAEDTSAKADKKPAAKKAPAKKASKK
ncbi:MAG: 50S ribosomal protein L17, partial [Bdellovibrionota bacterium]